MLLSQRKQYEAMDDRDDRLERAIAADVTAIRARIAALKNDVGLLAISCSERGFRNTSDDLYFSLDSLSEAYKSLNCRSEAPIE